MSCLSWGSGPGLSPLSQSPSWDQRSDGCGFGARLLLPGGLTTVQFCPSLVLLTVGEPLFVRAAVELGDLFNIRPHWERPSSTAWMPQGKPRIPSIPEGSTSLLLVEPTCHCPAQLFSSADSGLLLLDALGQPGPPLLLPQLQVFCYTLSAT